MSGQLDDTVDDGATDRLLHTIRRNPEGLLLIGAGCALLMRRGSARPQMRSPIDGGENRSTQEDQPDMRETSSRAGQRIYGTAEKLKTQATQAVTSYASGLADYAGASRRMISEQKDRLKSQSQSTLQSGIAMVR